MQRPLIPVLTLLIVASLSSLGTGCGARLTPEKVRELLDTPTGSVSPESMANATRDMFLADRATSIENFASILKLDLGSDDSSNALPGVSTGVLEDTGDVFCVGGLVASALAFDACKLGDECKSELTIDSCLLRVGDAGDEDARGKIKMKLENVLESDLERSTFGIEFDGWESTRDEGLLDAFAGVIALESTRATDDSSIDLVFASDLDVNLKRKQRGFFDDGIEERTNFTAGLRFQASETEDSAQGSLEILAFADADGGQDESLVVRLAAEGHRVNAAEAVASAALEVIGENGTFACTWNGERVEQTGSRDGVTVTSAGDCVDEDGETFSFEGTSTSN
jgi:hypothetical protein